MTDRLTGPPGFIVGAVILAAYVYVGLVPFEWDPPGWISNGANVTRRGGVRFRSPGIARTATPPQWLLRAIELNELTIRLRLRSFSPDQTGPARIFSVSADPSFRNLTIAQRRSNLVIRLRTPKTSLNGLPEYAIQTVFADTTWRDLEVTIAEGSLTVWLDGEVTLRESLPPKAFRNWDPSLSLFLGNESTGDRPWLGAVSRASVIVDGQEWDCLRAGAMQFPGRYWKTIRFQLLTKAQTRLEDVGLNFLCFIPFGFVLAAWRGKRGSLMLAVVICSLASFSVEVAQVFFATRMPSASDWSANTIGAITGALYSRYLVVNSGSESISRSRSPRHERIVT